MDPRQGFRHRFEVEEFKKNLKIGKIKKKIKELDRITQFKAIVVILLCFFLFLNFLGWSFVTLAWGISTIAGSIVLYWYSRNTDSLALILISVLALICGIFAQY